MTHFIKNNWQLELKRLEGAYAPETIRSYYNDVKYFVDWCEGRSLAAFPLNEATVLQYLDAVAGLSFNAIQRRLTAARKVNRLLGFDEFELTEEIHLAIRRIKRSKTMRPKQARGINIQLLERVIRAQPDTITGIRNRAILSLGYDFLARRSELTALRVWDVEFLKDGTLRGLIRRGKADQFGRGRLAFGSRRSAKLLRRWLKQKPAEIDWLFCALNHGNCLDRPLCGRSINDIVKSAVVKTRGERPREHEVSGHSLRVGAAQDLLIKGYDAVAIMRAGGWRSFGALQGYLALAEHNVWE